MSDSRVICGGCKKKFPLSEADSYKNTFTCPHCGHILNDD